MSNVSIQAQYWNEIVQLKAHVYYLGYHCRSADRWDFWVKVILAFSSSSSIAGWALWNDYSFVWAAIIAVSQVINAIKQLLPFEKRRKALTQVGHELSNLFTKAETDWYYVANGSLTEEDIHLKRMSLQKEKMDCVHRLLSDIMLPAAKLLEDKAAKDASDYFQNVYRNGA
jgi:hypothetical protein